MLSPANSIAVRTWKGILHTEGERVTKKKPATAEIVTVICKEIPNDLQGIRDRAILILGYAGAIRRSELFAIDVEDIEEVTNGIWVTVKQQKRTRRRKENESLFSMDKAQKLVLFGILTLVKSRRNPKRPHLLPN
jgi:site-specific recombinase XerC